MRCDNDWDDERGGALVKIMAEEMFHHVCLPVALGVKNLSLAAKFIAIAHTLRMETSCWLICKIICSNVVAITTDYGTESGLGNVPDLDMSVALPWWSVPTPIVADTADDVIDIESTAGQRLSFKNSIKTPGIEHTCHNALQQVLNHTHHYKGWLTKASAFARCMTNPYYTDRLKKQCLCDRGADHVVSLLDALGTIPDEGRFSNLMDCLMQALPLRSGLQWFYNAQLFQGECDKKSDDASYVDVSLVTEFIQNNECWMYGLMVLALGGGLARDTI